MTLLLSLINGITCPFAPCGPLYPLNKLVEGESTRWFLYDMPGHPVAPCPYPNPRNAPLSQRSVLLRPYSHPDSAPIELFRTLRFMYAKALPRVARMLRKRFFRT